MRKQLAESRRAGNWHEAEHPGGGIRIMPQSWSDEKPTLAAPEL